MRPRPFALLTIPIVAASLLSTPPALAADSGAPEWLPVVSHFEVFDAACADVLFVGARGSGESFEGDGLGDPVSAVRDAVRESLAGDITVRQAKLDYPAYPIQPRSESDLMSLVGGLKHTLEYLSLSAATGVVPDLSKLGYFASVDAGTAALLDLLEDSATRCPTQKVAIAGYSAGALVLHKALAAVGARTDNVTAVALIADPGRDAAARISSAGFYGTAQGETGAVDVVNSDALFAPVTEFLGTVVDPLPPELRERTYEVCNHGDYVCDPVGYGLPELLDVISSSAGTDTDAHTHYTQPGPVVLLQEAGARIASRVDGAVPGRTSIETLVSREVKTVTQVSSIMRTSVAAADHAGNFHAVYGNGSGWFDYTPTGINWATGEYRPFSTGIPGGTTNVNDIAFDQFGNAYSVFGRRPYSGSASDTRLHWAKYSPTGALLFSIELPRGSYSYTESNKIDVDADGHVFVSMIRGGLYEFNANGSLIGNPPCGGGGRDFAVRPDGSIHALMDPQMWSYTTSPDYVVTCDASGAQISTVQLPTTTATNIDVDSRGNAYVGDAPSLAILRVSAADNAVSTLPVPEVDWRAGLAVAVGTDSDVYATFVHPTDGSLQAVRFGYGTPVAFESAPTPVVSGTARVGHTLIAEPGVWMPADVSLTYQWFRGDEPIDGAGAQEYVISDLDVGAELHLEVTATALGYIDTVKASMPTARVRATSDPEPTANVAVVIAARCVVGKVVQTLTVTNVEVYPVSVAARGPYGQKSFAAIAPGKSASAVFTTRQQQIASGTVAITTSAIVNGITGTAEQSLAYGSATCG